MWGGVFYSKNTPKMLFKKLDELKVNKLQSYKEYMLSYQKLARSRIPHRLATTHPNRLVAAQHINISEQTRLPRSLHHSRFLSGL